MIKVNYDATTGKVTGFEKNTTPFIMITEEERRQSLTSKYDYYAVVDNKFTVKHREPTDDEKAKDALVEKNKRLLELQRWLNENDWKLNKVFLGEWAEDDPRWLEYKTKRAEVRAERDLLIKED